MKFEAKRWKMPTTSFDGWLCPYCGNTLKEDDDQRQLLRSNRCKVDQSHSAWEPEWIRGWFNAKLDCTNATCGELVSVSGSWRVWHGYGVDEFGEPTEEYIDSLSVENVSPPINLFPLPDGLPDNVIEHLSRAFSLYWIDKASCLNALRASLEAILTDQGVPKKFKTRKGKFEDAPLHKRIERIEKTNPAIADVLMAVKWLGNHGSHDNSNRSSLTEQADSAMTIMALALFDLYDPTKSTVHSLVKKVNKAKG